MTSVPSRAGSSFARTMSAVNFVNRLIPGIIHRLSNWMFKNNHFPWAPVDLDLIAFGTGAAVIRLRWKNADKVLRIYRRSLGKSYRGLLEIARYYKTNYETVRSWYGDAKNLVLPMEFFVLQGLPLIGPVAASLQPYIGGQKQDLFEDFTDEELISLLRDNNEVKESFLCFAGQTLRQWEMGRMCYDFLGRENIMLVKQGGTYTLHIVDVGIFKFDLPANQSPQKKAQIEQRIHRLSSLYGIVQGN